MVCLNCGLPITQEKGKRAKKFCSDKCRASHFQKNKPKKEKQTVSITIHQKALDRIKQLEAQISTQPQKQTILPKMEETPKNEPAAADTPILSGKTEMQLLYEKMQLERLQKLKSK